MCPLVYHHNGFVATPALGHMMYGYTLLVSMNQKTVLNKLSKEHNISAHKWSMRHKVLKSHRNKMSIIYMQSWKQCALSVIDMATHTYIHVYMCVCMFVYTLCFLYSGSMQGNQCVVY